MLFRFTDYLITPRDIAAGWRSLVAQGEAHHIVDALAAGALIIFMRLTGIAGASVVALVFVLWKFSLPRVRITDALDLCSLILTLWLTHFLWETSEGTLFFLAFLMILFRWRVDARVSIGAALACLIAIPLCLILFQMTWWAAGEHAAETLAVWAFYFLAIGVGKQIAELAAKPNSRHEDI